jgi:hypothetical protein
VTLSVETDSSLAFISVGRAIAVWACETVVSSSVWACDTIVSLSVWACDTVVSSDETGSSCCDVQPHNEVTVSAAANDRATNDFDANDFYLE